MASFDDLDAFFHRYTSSEQAIRVDYEEVQFTPYVETTFIDELSLLDKPPFNNGYPPTFNLCVASNTATTHVNVRNRLSVS